MANLKSVLGLIDQVHGIRPFNAKHFIGLFSDKQREYLNTTDRTCFYYGGKRAGKTLANTGLCILMDAVSETEARIVFASATIEKTKSLYWSNLLKANKSLGLGWSFHSGRNLIQTKKREIVFRGLRDIPSANLDVGFSVLCLILDEIHTIRSVVLKHYLNEVIRWNLLNIEGARICLTGNPPPVVLPFVDDLYRRKDIKKICTSCFDNPWLDKETIELFMGEEARERGLTLAEAKQSPPFRRAIYGEWIQDTGRLIVDSGKVQFFDKLPDNGKFVYVMGVDLGGGRAYDAIVLIAYDLYERKSYVVKEWEGPTDGRTLEELATRIKGYVKDAGKVDHIAVDFGGLGSRLAHILQSHYGIIGIHSAEKTTKMAYLEQMRTEIYAGRLVFKESSLLVNEFPQIYYTEDQCEVDDEAGIHSDLLDACLYSMRHIFNQYPRKRIVPKTHAEREIERRLRLAKGSKNKFHSRL